VIEFVGEALQDLSMEGRMTVCNMAIEGGARAGMVAPDEVTIEYLRGRPLAPSQENGMFDAAAESWLKLRSDVNAVFDREVRMF